VRSTVSFSPLILGEDHGFTSLADSIDSTPAMAFGVGLGFRSDEMGRIVFVIEESGEPENPVAVRAIEQFKQALLLSKPEVIDLPQDLTFAE
jgi:hypothetical protein